MALVKPFVLDISDEMLPKIGGSYEVYTAPIRGECEFCDGDKVVKNTVEMIFNLMSHMTPEQVDKIRTAIGSEYHLTPFKGASEDFVFIDGDTPIPGPKVSENPSKILDDIIRNQEGASQAEISGDAEIEISPEDIFSGMGDFDVEVEGENEEVEFEIEGMSEKKHKPKASKPAIKNVVVPPEDQKPIDQDITFNSEVEETHIPTEEPIMEFVFETPEQQAHSANRVQDIMDMFNDMGVA